MTHTSLSLLSAFRGQLLSAEYLSAVGSPCVADSVLVVMPRLVWLL